MKKRTLFWPINHPEHSLDAEVRVKIKEALSYIESGRLLTRIISNAVYHYVPVFICVMEKYRGIFVATRYVPMKGEQYPLMKPWDKFEYFGIDDLKVSDGFVAPYTHDAEVKNEMNKSFMVIMAPNGVEP